MNTMKFQDLVKGCHGRKIAYTDVEQITEDNIVKVIGDCIGVFITISQLSSTCGSTTKETSRYYTEQRFQMRISPIE